MTTSATIWTFELGCGARSYLKQVSLCFMIYLGTGCAGQLETRQGDQLDVSRYPSDIQAAYEVFAVRCSRCHTLARPLNARITDERHWVRYIARMRRHPGSGINRKNGAQILKFLLFYTEELRRMGESKPVPDRKKPPPAGSLNDAVEPVDLVEALPSGVVTEPSSVSAPASAPSAAEVQASPESESRPPTGFTPDAARSDAPVRSANDPQQPGRDQ